MVESQTLFVFGPATKTNYLTSDWLIETEGNQKSGQIYKITLKWNYFLFAFSVL